MGLKIWRGFGGVQRQALMHQERGLPLLPKNEVQQIDTDHWCLTMKVTEFMRRSLGYRKRLMQWDMETD